MNKAQALKKIQAVLQAPEEKRGLLKEQSNAELGEFFAAPWNHDALQELAYAITGMAWSDAMTEDITSRVIEVKTVGVNDRDYVDEDLRGMTAYWQGKGGDIQSGTMRHERTEVTRDTIVAAVDLHDDEIANNFWGSMSDLIRQSQEKMRQVPLERLINMLQEALPTGSTVDGDSVSANFTASTLTDDNVDSVLTTIRKYANGPITILGSEWAIHYLSNVGLTYGDNIASQVFTTGVIGQYKGAQVVKVGNFEDYFGNRVLPDNELWLVSQDSGRLTYFGNAAKTAVLRFPSFRQRWESERDAGILLYGIQHGRMGRIILD